jgi:GTP cyclohydrolase II
MAGMNAGLSLTGAQRLIGRPDSRVSYQRVPLILAHLGQHDPVVLLTGSEQKIRAIQGAGVRISQLHGLGPGRA